ncbi:MAG: hypothetical protein U1E61_18330 [Bradyrhizobium sp.]
MTSFFSDVPLSVLNQFLFILILNLIPLLIWAAWDLDHRRRDWLSRRRARGLVRQRHPSNI